MTDDVSRYNCPNCDAVYRLLRVDAPAEIDRKVTCLCCGGPLQGQDGRFVSKYMLLGMARRAGL